MGLFVFMAGGRPEANIDWELVDELLEADCSGAQIASFIGVSAHTLYDRCQTDKGVMFSEYSQQKKEKGDSLLKKVQFEAAVKDKDKAMMIWLGKQRLGQKDKQETENKYPDGISVNFVRVPDKPFETKD